MCPLRGQSLESRLAAQPRVMPTIVAARSKVTDTRATETAVLELTHSSEVYRRGRVFSPFGLYGWLHPREAWGALAEVFPWEAMAFSLFGSGVLWVKYGSDVGLSIGMSTALALCVLQLFRTRSFITSDQIVQQRGLIFTTQRRMPLSQVRGGRVVYPQGGPNTFGDVVLDTPAGELRLRALAAPDRVLATVMRLRDNEAHAGAA